MHYIRAKIDAAGPFHTSEIRIDGDGVEYPRVEQLQKHAATPFRFNRENSTHAVVEGDLQPALRKRLCGDNPNHVFSMRIMIP